MRSPISQLIDRVTRRVEISPDLEALTSYGEEFGDPDLIEPIWENVERVYRTGMFPGIQVVIRHENVVVMERAIGHSRGNEPGGLQPEAATPIGVDTPVNLFSAAKAVSAMAVHKLEELGAISIDDAVSDHVPGFERHNKSDITVRQVLSHRAGLPSLPREAFDLDLLVDPERIEAVLCELEPDSAPGGAPAYSAVTGGFVREAVARRAAGTSLRDVLAREIRDPLGLRWLDLGVAPEDVELVARNVETGLPLVLLMDKWMTAVLGTHWSHVLELSNDSRFLSGMIPSGNVIVTARDVAAFYQCLLNGGILDGTRVFEEATVARAVEPQGEGRPLDRKLFMPMRYSPGFMLGSESISFYGWNTPRLFGHLGMSNLYTWADPDRDLVVAFLTTGKAMLGTHWVALMSLLSGIHDTFSPESPLEAAA